MPHILGLEIKKPKRQIEIEIMFDMLIQKKA